ncbi:MAG TPA: TetR/AcrR family transcriptional regulator [Acidimicrobiales bacterium]|nr:TetR/AcrR family transcriptional regulator [Acidimicrobiales bacterium]
MDSEKLEMRRHILSAAARLLAESSHDKVRVSDVAEAAYVAAPTIYYHFGSLNRLMAEAQDLLYQQISAPLKESLALAELALANRDAETFWDVIGSHLVSAWESGQRGQESGVVKVFTGVLTSADAKSKFDQMIDETVMPLLASAEETGSAPKASVPANVSIRVRIITELLVLVKQAGRWPGTEPHFTRSRR